MRNPDPLRYRVQKQNRPRLRYGPVQQSFHALAPIVHYSHNPRVDPSLVQGPEYRYRSPELYHPGPNAQGSLQYGHHHPLCRRYSDRLASAARTVAPLPASLAHVAFALFYISLEGNNISLSFQPLLISLPRRAIPNFKMVTHASNGDIISQIRI